MIEIFRPSVPLDKLLLDGLVLQIFLFPLFRSLLKGNRRSAELIRGKKQLS